MPNSIAKYGKVGKNLMNGNIDIITNGVKIIFLESSYTPNMDTHETITDLVLASNECSGDPYTSGGLLIDGEDITETYSSQNKNTLYSCPDQTLENATISDIKYIAFADRSTGYLLGLQTFADAQAPSGQQFKLKITNSSAGGFLTI